MTAKVIYLNSWLDCPDIILRRHYEMQDRILRARISFFHKLKEEGKTESQALFLYQIWIQKNRQRIKLEKYEDTTNTVDSDIPPAS